MLTDEAPAPLSFPADHLTIQAWPDPVIDQLGHDPRSAYVERFWLGILGPSTVWLLRRLADGLDHQPDGFVLDLPETAKAIGVGMRGGRHSPFMRSIERVCRFGAARWQSPTELGVRRKLAPLTRGQIERMPPSLQVEHRRFTEPNRTRADGVDLGERARQLALSLLELGEDAAATERQLHHWRFHPALAYEAVRWASERHALRQAPAQPAADL